MAEHTETVPHPPFEPEAVEENQSLFQRLKEHPMVPIGVSGMIGMVAYGAYNYKNRGKMSTSVYLMHLRVKAQGMVVGALAIGATYTLIKDFFGPKEDAASSK